MFAFLILLTISLPNGEVGRFKVSSRGQFDQMTCVKQAGDYAERLSSYAKRRAPFAVVSTVASCELRITRPV